MFASNLLHLSFFERAAAGVRGVRAQLSGFSRLIGAVLLQDMRTRFGTSALGFLIAIGWPLSHLVILSGMYYFRTLIAPVGDSPALFVSTGAVPYILCLYPARTMAITIPQNRQLLNIPAIKPAHLIYSRAILEILNAMIVLGIYVAILLFIDIDILPIDHIVAAKAIAANLYLGISLGVANVVLVAMFGNFYMVFFIVLMVGLYIFSGVYVPLWVLPETLKEYLVAFNPMVTLVEWLRSAYYVAYDNEPINKSMVLCLATVSLVFGLLGERYLRGKMLS